MTEDGLLALAFAAIEDEGSRVVLADALAEASWVTRANGILLHNVMLPTFADQTPHAEWDAEEYFRLGFRPGAAHMFCAAIAAVLLCKEWDTEMWSMMRRCDLGRVIGRAIEVRADGLVVVEVGAPTR